MKKRTLNQTWILCLRMWRWIAKTWTKDGPSVEILKRQWLEGNRFDPCITNTCFFCSYALDEEGYINCSRCPGRLVSRYFRCTVKRYLWEYKPVEFYEEILRLNKIRKAKK